MTEPMIVVVKHWDGHQVHRAAGRAAYMVAFILANADRINRAPRGSLSFNFDGPALRPEIHEAWPHVNTEGK